MGLSFLKFIRPAPGWGQWLNPKAGYEGILATGSHSLSIGGPEQTWDANQIHPDPIVPSPSPSPSEQAQPGSGPLTEPSAEPAESLKLSIVVPMYNEEENVEKTVRRIGETMEAFKDGAWELILVNDGSRDRTFPLAEELAARPEYPFLRILGYTHNRGRGYALRTGFAAARGEWIVATDADLSYEPAYILQMTEILRDDDDVDMVLASAYMPGGEVEDAPLDRYLASRLGNILLSWFMSSGNQKVHTITCVFRAYRRQVLDDLELESEGKDIHLEILSKAMMLGYHYKEIPATLRWRQHGDSKFRFGTTAISHLIFALFERPIIVFGILGLQLLLCSIAGMVYLFYVYLSKGEITAGRPLLTLIVLTFLGGLQLLAFGIIGTQFVNLRKEIIRIQRRLRMVVGRRKNSDR